MKLAQMIPLCACACSFTVQLALDIAYRQVLDCNLVNREREITRPAAVPLNTVANTLLIAPY